MTTESFTGQVVVVLGGAGLVGSAITLQLLAKGATVAVASRSESSLATLRQWAQLELAKLGGATVDTSKLLTFHKDITTEEGAQELLAAIKGDKAVTGGRIDHVVVSLGSWALDGPVLGVSLKRFHEQLDNYVTSHFIALKTFLPVIADQAGSTFINVTGTVGEGYLVPGSGIVTVGASALYGLLAAVREEYKERPVRLYEYRVGMVVKRQDQEGLLQPWEVTDKKIGAIGAGLVAYQSDQKNQIVRVVPETLEQVASTFIR